MCQKFQNPDNMGFYLIKAFSLSKLIEQFQGLTISKNLVSASQDAVLMWASNGKKNGNLTCSQLFLPICMQNVSVTATMFAVK